MPNKRFSERLNNELDTIGVPESSSERVDVFAKLLKVPKFKAEALLTGQITPDENLLTIIAEELEVNEEWLLGKSDKKDRAN